MSEMQRLISEIDEFLAKTGMAATTFGQKSVRNWRIVGQLKSDGNVGMKTADRLRQFMREHSKSRAA